MAQGKYARKRRKSSSTVTLWIASLILVILLIILIFVIIKSGVFAPKEATDLQTGPSISTQEPTLPPTEPTEEATTATEPATQPTQPPTEATEEPTQPTEAPTEATEAPTETTPPAPSDKGQAVADFAREQLGKPYLYGGSGPDAFDTTGFISYCFQENGISAPRTLNEQAAYGVEVSVEDLQPGDVLFFWTSNPGEVEYPAIYIGDGKMVAARNSEHPVSEMSFNLDYFTERFLFARRYY